MDQGGESRGKGGARWEINARLAADETESVEHQEKESHALPYSGSHSMRGFAGLLPDGSSFKKMDYLEALQCVFHL